MSPPPTPASRGGGDAAPRAADTVDPGGRSDVGIFHLFGAGVTGADGCGGSGGAGGSRGESIGVAQCGGGGAAPSTADTINPGARLAFLEPTNGGTPSAAATTSAPTTSSAPTTTSAVSSSSAAIAFFTSSNVMG
eukprot:CAMPEP_0184716502 /NCGR_PEP_ID=MMETSP0314-20130426/6241_1 /TAXON_ID=38298 /ORGANISM="Rhodella maculata, Strain CCMP 736" /LENGTH=134 /DNA_ID=CAMNT_0027179923 /DNA_START=52 /DNA_END=456 /DNA_ORIENTATION=+